MVEREDGLVGGSITRETTTESTATGCTTDAPFPGPDQPPPMTHWTRSVFVENPDLFVGDLEARVDEADDEVTDLLALLDANHGLRPETGLDVACGVGRHAVALAERGVATTGVDIAQEYVARARDMAADAGVAEADAAEADAPEADATGAAQFVEGDMRDLALDGRFDLVLSAWTAFGYYDDGTNRDVLAGLYDRVADGGALVVEVANKEGVLADFDDDGVGDVDGRHVVETREYDPETSRMVTERWVHDDETGERLGTYDIDLRLYAPVELRRLCEDVGFDSVALYAGFEGGELRHDSTRLLVVAER